MIRRVLAYAAVAGALTMAGRAQEAAQASRRQSYPVLGIAYANGRTAHQLLKPTRRDFYTTVFPRVSGAPPTSPNELVVYFQLTGETTTVNIAVRHSTTRSDERTVATVTVGAKDSVIVDKALAEVGVAPIRFFRTTVPVPDVAAMPQVLCNPEVLHASVTPLETDDGFALQLSLENHSPRAIRSIAFMSFRGARPSIGGSPKGSEGQPLIAANDRTALSIPVSLLSAPDGTATFGIPDRVVIRAALDVDGKVYGDPAAASENWIADLGARVEAERIAATFRGLVTNGASADAWLSSLDSTLRALPVDADQALIDRAASHAPAPGLVPEASARSLIQIGMRSMRDSVVSGVADFRSAPNAGDPSAVRHWLESQAARYDAWAARLPK